VRKQKHNGLESSSRMALSYVENPQLNPETNFPEASHLGIIGAMPEPTYSSNVDDDATSEVNSWDGSSSLQPAELLNTNAKTGKFSLENVLSMENGLGPSGVKQSEESSSDDNMSQSMDDPIRCKILNFPVALGLFDR
jgi:hypothetical protein